MADFGFELLAKSDGRSFKAGETIIRDGDSGSDMFVIKSGSVQILIGGKVVETLSDNDIFGELALIDSAPRNGTAVALTDAEVVPVGEKQFLFLVREMPYFALNVMRVLTRRLRTANRTM